jgi:hypothetical protein
MLRLTDTLRVVLPWTPVQQPSEVRVSVAGAQQVARLLSVLIPALMIGVGLTLAVTGAVLAERPGTEAEGSFGVEFGAALWFGGTLVLGARRRATLGRLVALAVLALGGVVLIAASVWLQWTGAALALAMEFGVGAVAVALIDVALLGTIQAGVEKAADAPDTTVTLRVQSQWPVVRLEAAPSAVDPLGDRDLPGPG